MVPAFGLLGLMCLVPEVFLRFFGKDYMVGSLSLGIFAVGQIFYVTLGLIEGVLNMTGYAHVALINAVVWIVLNWVLLIWFVPSWGILGAATATSLATAIVAVWRLLQARALLQIWPFHRSQLKPFTALLAALAVTMASIYFIGKGDDLRLGFQIALFLGTYIGILLLLRSKSMETTSYNTTQALRKEAVR
jgi:O-antigen/teichoic acid export membrane protein